MKDTWKSRGAAAALIALLTVVVYLPALTAGFVFDDSQNVTANQSLRTLEGLKRIWIDPQASFQYYPLTYTSFWIEYHLWGLHPAGYHAVNILLHALNALLIGLLLGRLGVPGAWLAALLFALHPVHVQSVAWVSERKNVLSGFFYLSSLLTYLRFVEGAKPRGRFYGLALGLFVCALLSKTSAVSMPLAVLLILWWKQKRVRGQDGLALVPFVLAGAALGLLTAWVEVRYSGAQGPEWQLSWLERCLVAGRVVWFYAGKLLWPHPLMVAYPRWPINTAVWWQYLFPCAAGAVILALWWWRQRLGKAPLVAVVFFVATLVPIPAFISVAFMNYSYVADHWQYLPSIGLIALAGACVGNLQGRTVRTTVSVMAAVVLSALSWRHCEVFHDEETLFTDNLVYNPQSWLAHCNLGVALAGLGRLQEAMGHFEQALQLKPDYAEAHNTLGVTLAGLGRMHEAIEHWEQALKIRPDMAGPHYSLGLALVGLGRVQEAMGHFEQALQLKPDYAEAHYHLGLALVRLGRAQEAMGHWEQALRINPDMPETHYNLAVALEQAGRFGEAIGHYEQALRLKPDYTEAHYNLGLALVRLGRAQEAMGYFEQALRITPDYAEAHNNLGVTLAGLGRVQEAIGHYEQALRIKPDVPEVQNNLAWLLATLAPTDGGDPVRAVTLAERACALTGHQMAPYLDTLAAAYAAAGRFNDAIATAEKAIELARTAGLPQVVSEIESHIELYRSGHPYRQLRTPVGSGSLDGTSPHSP